MILGFYKIFIVSALVILSFSVLTAQQENPLPCGTSEYLNYSLQHDSIFRKNRKLLEDFTIQFAQNSSNREASKIIPVVFHIIHNYGSENISDEQAIDAIRIVNEDFRKLNKDISSVVSAFSGISADIGVEFRLARKDPNGKCTNGITRVVSTQTFSAGENVKKLVSWPTNKYLNVWVVSKIASGVGGYSVFPGNPTGTPTDGIIIAHSQLGSIGTSIKTNFAARSLTHEIGHWFNLSHVWGDGEIDMVDNCYTPGDYVDDTPYCRGTINISCNLNQNTCNSGTLDKIDNVQNYMDYSGCACMFTVGQKNRMLAALNSSISGRNNLWSSTNLAATGVDGVYSECIPIADFSINSNQACSNSTLLFFDESYNAKIDSTWKWEWTINGGTPSASNLRNPIISFSSPGTYSVTLKVTNSAGSASITKQKFITISSDVPTLTYPVFEGFESALFPNVVPVENRWRIEGNSTSFNRTTNAKATGAASIRYINFQQLPGNVVSLISPAIDFSQTTKAAMVVFKVAAARLVSSSADKLEVYSSRDCGKTWYKSYSKTGSELYTVPINIPGQFNPTANQWRADTVKLTSLLIGKRSVMVKFVITDGNGNDIFLDDINILYEPLVGIEDQGENNEAIRLFPNPSKGDAELIFPFKKEDLKSISVLDLSGRMVATRQYDIKTASGQSLMLSELNGSVFKQGVYFILIHSKQGSSAIKWVVH